MIKENSKGSPRTSTHVIACLSMSFALARNHPSNACRPF